MEMGQYLNLHPYSICQFYDDQITCYKNLGTIGNNFRFSGVCSLIVIESMNPDNKISMLLAAMLFFFNSKYTKKKIKFIG